MLCRAHRCAPLLLSLILVSPTVQAESAVILKQSKTPLTITSYTASYVPELSRSPEMIRHKVSFQNTSPKEVVALQIGLTAFDAFNGFMGRFSGWSIEKIPPGGLESGEWTQRPYAAFSFMSYGTGVAYVNAVRFSDGSIWRANLSEVLAELQKFEKDLKREDLADKKEK